ncbi:SHOCT domain-containing protein [Oceanithermus sp.]|uniref:SHOCT domain-containing protein n=1 Tax=Oceanithermus sp. TaxID=2268145 RepID=UPI0025FB1500|nr:SHOCT domain-containing protein [Oceanithermus sp.]
MFFFFPLMLLALWALWRVSVGGPIFESRRSPAEDALGLLRRRYAAGEIDDETYRQLRRDLEV